MKTALIPGVALRADDDRILAALKKCRFDGGGNTMIIGIRNEAGAIYRGVTTVGMGDFMQAVGALQKLGLTDELAESIGMREKCDAIFS